MQDKFWRLCKWARPRLPRTARCRRL